jgi:hypothetical protein
MNDEVNIDSVFFNNWWRPHSNYFTNAGRLVTGFYSLDPGLLSGLPGMFPNPALQRDMTFPDPMQGGDKTKITILFGGIQDTLDEYNRLAVEYWTRYDGIAIGTPSSSFSNFLLVRCYRESSWVGLEPANCGYIKYDPTMGGDVFVPVVDGDTITFENTVLNTRLISGTAAFPPCDLYVERVSWFRHNNNIIPNTTRLYPFPGYQSGSRCDPYGLQIIFYSSAFNDAPPGTGDPFFPLPDSVFGIETITYEHISNV